MKKFLISQIIAVVIVVLVISSVSLSLGKIFTVAAEDIMVLVMSAIGLAVVTIFGGICIAGGSKIILAILTPLAVDFYMVRGIYITIAVIVEIVLYFFAFYFLWI